MGKNIGEEKIISEIYATINKEAALKGDSFHLALQGRFQRAINASALSPESKKLFMQNLIVGITGTKTYGAAMAYIKANKDKFLEPVVKPEPKKPAAKPAAKPEPKKPAAKPAAKPEAKKPEPKKTKEDEEKSKKKMGILKKTGIVLLIAIVAAGVTIGGVLGFKNAKDKAYDAGIATASEAHTGVVATLEDRIGGSLNGIVLTGASSSAENGKIQKVKLYVDATNEVSENVKAVIGLTENGKDFSVTAGNFVNLLNEANDAKTPEEAAKKYAEAYQELGELVGRQGVTGSAKVAVEDVVRSVELSDNLKSTLTTHLMGVTDLGLDLKNVSLSQTSTTNIAVIDGKVSKGSYDYNVDMSARIAGDDTIYGRGLSFTTTGGAPIPATEMDKALKLVYENLDEKGNFTGGIKYETSNGYTVTIDGISYNSQYPTKNKIIGIDGEAFSKAAAPAAKTTKTDAQTNLGDEK